MKLTRFALWSLIFALPLAAQQRGRFNADAPRPVAALDSVWIEELTWMEVRDAVKAGKTTVIIPAGSTEQNGPYVPTQKHVYVLRATSEAIARKLGNALVAPIIPFEPGDPNKIDAPGTVAVRQEIFEGLIADEATSMKQSGFKHVMLIGDSGGDQRGLDAVARKLSVEWAGSGAAIHYIPEYYKSWEAADASWASMGIVDVREGIHDDYSVNAIIATVDPEKIRTRQRIEANKATINGASILPIEKTIANGKKLVDLRAGITVEAIRKAIQPK